MRFYITSCYVLLLFSVLEEGRSGRTSKRYVTYQFRTTRTFMNWVDETGHLLFSHYVKENDETGVPCCGTGESACLCDNSFVCLHDNVDTCINRLFGNSLESRSNQIKSHAHRKRKTKHQRYSPQYLLKEVNTLIIKDNAFNSVIEKDIFDFNRIKNLTIFTSGDVISWNSTYIPISKTKNLISLSISSLFSLSSDAIDIQPNLIFPKLEYLNVAGIVKSSDLFWFTNTKIKCLNIKHWMIYDDSDIETLFNNLPRTLTEVDIGPMSNHNHFLRKLGELNTIRMLALAGAYLTEIPSGLSFLASSLHYLSLNSNSFTNISKERPHRLIFPYLPQLLELDLRNCGIEYLDQHTFYKMPKMRKLAISGNRITQFDNYFKYLPNLIYLDISANRPIKVALTLNRFQLFNSINSDDDFVRFKNYVNNPLYVDLSFSYFEKPKSEISYLPIDTTHVFLNKAYAVNLFYLQKLRRLQMVYINDIKSASLGGRLDIKALMIFISDLKTLKELHLVHSNVQDFYLELLVKNLTNLRVLKLPRNSICSLNKGHFSSLKHLESLDLSRNNINTWQHKVFKYNSKLRMLNVSWNKISMMTQGMIEDFSHLRRLDITGNPLLCNKHLHRLTCLPRLDVHHSKKNFCYDEASGNITSFKDFMKNRNCAVDREEKTYTKEPLEHHTRKMRILTEATTVKSPALFANGGSDPSYNVYSGLIIFLVIVLLCVGTGVTVYFNWYTISYYLTLIKVSKGSVLFRKHTKKTPNFQYDVFVSYSENDRFWVLDQLLPHLETKAGLRICLHERDFQIGISIMENIMDNMHRSHRVLLVISKSFINSRWCQFEMNLAQFLLVEMRDRHVILVFLEDIPKTKRPKLLRYLMATKTYLEWPQEQSNKFDEERHRFFKRLSVALYQGSGEL